MGNLRDKYTNDEWNSILDDIKNSISKPENSYIKLNISSKSIEELKILKNVLSKHFNLHEISCIDSWIKFRQNKQL